MPNNRNLYLCLEHIKKYIDAFDQLPPEVKSRNYEKKKENAQAALEYLIYFCNSKIGAMSTDSVVGDVQTFSPCGPRPKILGTV